MFFRIPKLARTDTLSTPDPVSSASSSSDSSFLPSLPSSPSPAEVEFSQPSKFIPPPPVGSCSNRDLLHEDLSSTSKKRKEPDSPKDRHENIRKKARNNTLISANKMANYYNKTKAAKSTDFQVGDKFSFYVPKTDRCSTDLQRIPGEIVSVTGGEKIKFYKVVTSAGLLKNAFSGGDLAPFNGPVHVNKDKLVSVRQAALEINAANKFTVNSCKCKGKCSNAQCSCIRSGILCSNHCHSGRNCQNREKSDKQLYLNNKDIEIVQTGWLTDNHMLLANNILKSSNIGEKGNCVNLYDSLYNGVSQTTKELIGNYMNEDTVKINVINVQQQKNGSDCGVFAIAYAQCLLEGKNPAEYDFKDPRKHLAHNLPNGSLPKFPKVLAEHLPVVLHKDIYIQLKPVEKSMSDYEEDILCLL